MWTVSRDDAPVQVEEEPAEVMPQVVEEEEDDFGMDDLVTVDVAPAERPANTIEDEMIFRFDSEEELQRFLAALQREGLAPRGVLRQLYAVRVSERVALSLDPRAYGGREEHNFYSARPVPPEAFAPGLFARLQGFGLTAAEIAQTGDSTSGQGVIVAVLDSGVDPDLDFEDLRGVWLDYVGTEPSYRHGTSVASIVAGPLGIAPATTILSVRVLDENGVGNSFDLARGIIEATNHGARIINMSLGVYGESPILLEAIRYAYDQGVIMVASAGNEAVDRLPYPAADSRVLAVTAIDANRQHALFPNQARGIDFAAPGVGVIVQDGEGESLFSGTSAAAPMISGTLASLLSKNPALAPESAIGIIRQNLDDAGLPGADDTFGGGIVSWDRIERRNQTNVVDVAIADIHIPHDAVPGQTTPVTILVQNRGTAWLGDTTLTVQTSQGEPETFTVGSLDAGGVAPQVIYVSMPNRDSGEFVDVLAQVSPPGNREDVDLSNNLRVRRISAAPSAE
ncbi:MAG: hypothetical protein EA353_14370 [Puniceicoccaceae bacterium]|nr:MAG: hypothetical protein EA353_14370 [Puniceicoccaceae bacterium]